MLVQGGRLGFLTPARMVSVVFVLLACVSCTPKTYAPLDPTSEDFFLLRAVRCSTGAADCETAAADEGSTAPAAAPATPTALTCLLDSSAVLDTCTVL